MFSPLVDRLYLSLLKSTFLTTLSLRFQHSGYLISMSEQCLSFSNQACSDAPELLVDFRFLPYEPLSRANICLASALRQGENLANLCMQCYLDSSSFSQREKETNLKMLTSAKAKAGFWANKKPLSRMPCTRILH